MMGETVSCLGRLPRSLLLLLALLGAHGNGAPAAEADAAVARRYLALFEQELEVVRRLEMAGRAFPAREWAFRHVSIVDVERGGIAADMRVTVAGGRIRTVAPDDASPLPPEVTAIDGSGQFLAPGLADMHVHQLVSLAAQQLLHVATGVTTVRDMNGYPWMLTWRERSARDGWLAPDMIVAGHILAAAPMGDYATVVTSEAEARAAVRAQAAAGYDYIKVHNILPLPLYDAVVDEARRAHIGVVGHVPQDITVAHAIASGQQTLEHLKGYLLDRGLEISREDWVTPTRWGTAWNCPTLIASARLRGAAADTWFAGEEARYVPPLWLAAWHEEAKSPLSEANRTMLAKQLRIMQQLIPVTHRFLAGTDSGGGFSFMVPGFALLEELRLLHQAGLSNLEALRAATWYAAQASDRTHEFGLVAVGLRANLVLLSANPLLDLQNLRHPSGVMLRGRWLDRASLERQLRELADLYAAVPAVASDPSLPDAAWIAGFLGKLRQVKELGYVVPERHLEQMSLALRRLGFDGAAADVRAMGTGPK